MVAANPTISTAELANIARTLRSHVLKMIAQANSGHPGGSLSAVDIITALYFGRVLRHDPKNPEWPDRDRFILSKGHGVPAQYAALAEAGYFPVSELLTLRQVNSRMQGIPCRGSRRESRRAPAHSARDCRWVWDTRLLRDWTGSRIARTC